MSYVVEATYEHGVWQLAQPFPCKAQEKVRVTVESRTTTTPSVLDIEPDSVGTVYRPLCADDDRLGGRLAGR
jgi:predicted DNA-binding antitoxin AbrB/MazE fold protein